MSKINKTAHTVNAQVLRDETVISANTNDRVYQLLKDIIDSMTDYQQFVNGTATGTDTKVATIPGIDSYSSSAIYFIRNVSANSGASTLNITGVGAKAIKKDGAGTDVIASELPADSMMILFWNSANDWFQLVGSVGGGGGTPSDWTVALVHAATSKTTPADNDELGILDSAASFVLKKLTWANLKATLKTYFDTLYTSGRTVVTSNITGAVSIDLSTGGMFLLTLTGNVTSFTFTNEVVGKDYIFVFIQGTTHYTISWTAGKFSFPFGTAITLTDPTTNGTSGPAYAKDIVTGLCTESGKLNLVTTPDLINN